MVISRSTRVAANGMLSLFFMGEYYSTMYLYHITTMEYYSAIKKKKKNREILSSGMTWRDLEDLMLSDINQTEKDKHT